MKTEELIEWLKSCAEKNCPMCPDVESCTGPSLLLRKAAEWLESTTATADTIVHCEDCEYYCYFGAFGECRHPSMGSDDRDAYLDMKPDDFCSRGIRKQ